MEVVSGRWSLKHLYYGEQLTDVGDDQVTCEAACQSSNSVSSSSDVSVQTDMSCTLVGLEIRNVYVY